MPIRSTGSSDCQSVPQGRRIGNPTYNFKVDGILQGLLVSFTEIVKSCGDTEAWRVEPRDDLAEKVAQLRSARGPAMLEIMVQKVARADLDRP